MPCKHNDAIKCNCTYACPRRGKCCDCVAYHRRNGEFPACFFTNEAERMYDRSLEALMEDRKET